MASRGPDRVPGPPLWLPACKVVALLFARSARPGGHSASDIGISGTDCIISTATSGQVRALANDFADPLGPDTLREEVDRGTHPRDPATTAGPGRRRDQAGLG